MTWPGQGNAGQFEQWRRKVEKEGTKLQLIFDVWKFRIVRITP